VPEIIEENCTGCAICHAACPVDGTIKMVPRTTDYHIDRGTEPSPDYAGMRVIKVQKY